MHLREFNAWRRLKERSAPIPITTPWMRKPAALVISLAAVYHPVGVIGMVVPLHEAEIDDPHFSIVLFFVNKLIIKVTFINP